MMARTTEGMYGIVWLQALVCALFVVAAFFAIPRHASAITVWRTTGVTDNSGGWCSDQNSWERSCAWSNERYLQGTEEQGDFLCGVWSGDSNGFQGLHPLWCQWSDEAKSYGASNSGNHGYKGYGTRYVDDHGGGGMCNPTGSYNEPWDSVIVGIGKWGSSGQLDASLCQGVNLGSLQWQGYTEITIPAAWGASVRCPANAVAVGYRYEPTKNDAWRYLECGYLSPPLPPPPPPPPPYRATYSSDNINNPSPLSFTLNECKGTNPPCATAQSPFTITWQNTGSQAWASNLRGPELSRSGTCDSSYSGSGFSFPAPSLSESDGTECRTQYNFSSSEVVMRHPNVAGGFTTQDPAQYARTVNVRVYVNEYWNPDINCWKDYDNGGEKVCDGGLEADRYMSATPSININPGETVPFYTNYLTAPGTGGGTYTENWTVERIGAPISDAPHPETLNVSGFGDITVNSVSTAVAEWYSPAPTRLLAVASPETSYSDTGDGNPKYCGAGTVMCGIRTFGTDNQFDPDDSSTASNVKASIPLCCSIAVTGLGTGNPASCTGGSNGSLKSDPGGGTSCQIDTTTNGAPLYCPPNQVVQGGVWGNSNQLDKGRCRSLTGGTIGSATSCPAGSSLIGGRCLVPVSPIAYHDYYCPAGQLIVGGKNAPGKDDSWNSFYCAPIAGISPSALKPVSALWHFSYETDDPCMHGSPCNPTADISGFYTGVKAGQAVGPIPDIPYPAGFTLKGVSPRNLADEDKKFDSLFADLWNKVVSVARASWRVVPPSRITEAAATISFVIEWDPIVPGSPPVPPPTANIRANGPGDLPSDGPITVLTGTEVTFTWESTYATTCSLMDPLPPNGPDISGTSGSANYTPTGSRIYRMRCANSNTGVSADDTVRVNVQDPVSCTQRLPTAGNNVDIRQRPTFRAENGVPGDYSWFANGTNGSTVGGSPPTGSSQEFSPRYLSTGPKTVVVTSGIDADSCTVNVVDINCTLTATPRKIVAPEEAILSWVCNSAATSCNLTADIGASPGPVAPPAGGSVTVEPRDTTTYTLTCSNGLGAVDTPPPSVTVEVVRPPRCEANPFDPECLNNP